MSEKCDLCDKPLTGEAYLYPEQTNLAIGSTDPFNDLANCAAYITTPRMLMCEECSDKLEKAKRERNEL